MRWFVNLSLGLGGLFCLVAAATDWTPFFEDHRASLVVGPLGRGGARVAYALFGLGLIGGGLGLGRALRSP